MTSARPMECPACDQVVIELRPGVPRIHYKRGTNDLCPGKKPDGTSAA